MAGCDPGSNRQANLVGATMREIKPWSALQTYSEMGRTRSLIECPFCGVKVWGYHWSMAGSGKKCPGCGALHSMYGTARNVEAEMTRTYVNATCPKCESDKVYVQGSLFVCEACDFRGEPGEFIYQALDEGVQDDRS